MPAKRPKVLQSFPTGKRAVVAQLPREDNDLRVSWRFGDADRNGRWRWSAVTEGEAPAILTFLSEMDKLTWAEAQQGWRPRAKRVETSGICADAQARLVDLTKDDLDHLDEWRLSGPERIWGIRAGHVCHVLWWDPDHSVWPSDPD